MAVNQFSPKQSKASIARELGIARSSLYYRHSLPVKDLQLVEEIKQVMKDNSAYGHRRIAWELHINHKRALRVMKLFNLKTQRQTKQPKKPEDIGKEPMAIPNLLTNAVIDSPEVAWQSDFTYIKYFGKFLYLATVINSYTRQILAWQLATRHTTEFISEALLDALAKYPAPRIFHSDQGSEYRSNAILSLLTNNGIKPSMSAKASPWQNGRQESFYGKFKLELGHPENYPTLGQLMEAIAGQIHYYNHKRIHTALKCSPNTFYQRYQITNLLSLTQAVAKEQCV